MLRMRIIGPYMELCQLIGRFAQQAFQSAVWEVTLWALAAANAEAPRQVASTTMLMKYPASSLA
jgi:hypothetical protein